MHFAVIAARHSGQTTVSGLDSFIWFTSNLSRGNFYMIWRIRRASHPRRSRGVEESLLGFEWPNARIDIPHALENQSVNLHILPLPMISSLVELGGSPQAGIGRIT